MGARAVCLPLAGSHGPDRDTHRKTEGYAGGLSPWGQPVGWPPTGEPAPRPATAGGRRMRGHTEEALVIDRRQFVTVAGSLVAACVASSLRRALATAPPASEVTERLDALFDVFMDERLTKNPDQLTVLGLDKGKRSEEHTSELQSPCNLVCRLLL